MGGLQAQALGNTIHSITFATCDGHALHGRWGGHTPVPYEMEAPQVPHWGSGHSSGLQSAQKTGAGTRTGSGVRRGVRRFTD